MKEDLLTSEVEYQNENISEIIPDISPGRYMSVEQINALEKLDKKLQPKIQSVLRRYSLAGTLQNEDVRGKVAQTIGEFELPALRTHLLLTCVNYLGELNRSYPEQSFLNWLDSNNSKRSNRDDAISKSLTTMGSVDDLSKAVKLIKSVFAQYRLNSSESNFASFFTNGLDQSTKEWISEKCWVYQDNPLEKWANLQRVNEGYSNNSTSENKRLTNARKRWDSLKPEQRLTEFAQLLEYLYQLYEKCIVIPPVKTDKDPISKIWKDIDLAVEDHRINYLSNNLFNHLGQEGQKFKFSEVKCVYKDDELYILEPDIKDKDRELWLKRLSEWLSGKIDAAKAKGETIFVPSKNQALVLADKSLQELLEDWIDSSINQASAI